MPSGHKQVNRDYRSRIYATYASRNRSEETSLDAKTARRRRRYLAKTLRGWLPDDSRAAITDLGCGAGHVLAAFESFGYRRLAGVDHSREQVHLARQIASGVVEGDVFDYLEGDRAHFDLITAFDLIEHLEKEDVLRFLDACHRCLETNGRLVLQTPNAESPWGPALRYGDFTHEVCFTPGSLTWLLQLSGFEEIEVREAGPRLMGLLSLGRVLLWWPIRIALAVWNLAETGSVGSGIYTRVFLISAVKR